MSLNTKDLVTFASRLVNKRHLGTSKERMEQVTQNTIDIEKVLKSKMGPKARFVPKPLTNWLKHIIHQDEVNKYLYEKRFTMATELRPSQSLHSRASSTARQEEG